MEHKIAAERVNRLFTHCLEQLEQQHAATTSPRLSDAQNALLAYLRLDKIAEDEGFAMLIALGYGEELFCGQLAEQLAAWGVPVLPDIVLQARGLYRELGAAIGAAWRCGNGARVISAVCDVGRMVFYGVRGDFFEGV